MPNLVLARKVGQSIRVGDDICVTVTRVKGDRATFSIRAPAEVKIVRSELETFGTSQEDECDE